MKGILVIVGAVLLICYGAVYLLRIKRVRKIETMLHPEPMPPTETQQIPGVTREQVQNSCRENDAPVEDPTS